MQLDHGTNVRLVHLKQGRTGTSDGVWMRQQHDIANLHVRSELHHHSTHQRTSTSFKHDECRPVSPNANSPRAELPSSIDTHFTIIHAIQFVNCAENSDRPGTPARVGGHATVKKQRHCWEVIVPIVLHDAEPERWNQSETSWPEPGSTNVTVCVVLAC